MTKKVGFRLIFTCALWLTPICSLHRYLGLYLYVQMDFICGHIVFIGRCLFRRITPVSLFGSIVETFFGSQRCNFDSQSLTETELGNIQGAHQDMDSRFQIGKILFWETFVTF